MQGLDRLKLSLDKASNFIKNMRNADGFWSDFLTLAGESVYWVSGYVGYALIDYLDVREENLVKEIGFRILRHQGEEGGWGYGPGVPADADSTSWCLLFLSKLGITNLEALEKAITFLLIHQNRFDGGFRTYAFPTEVGSYMGLDERISFEGWCSSQICVTAVAVQALQENYVSKGVREALDFIRGAQNKEGYWEPYWWNEKLYATFNSMKALGAGGSRDDAKLLRRAQDWIAGNQLENGGWGNSAVSEGIPFSTALALRGLMLGHRPEFQSSIRKGVEWILTHQLADGGWSSYHILRIPHPAIKHPWKQSSWKRNGKAINALIEDHNRLYSTATAFSALLEYKEMLSKAKIKNE